MSSSNIDTQRRIATIRERRAQLTRILESQKRILDYCDRNDLWENMPWFDTRPQKRSGDLLHVFIAGSKVRELLTSDIERINKHMKLLESELARARRVQNRTNRIRNARDDLRISEQRVRQDIDRIIRNAENAAIFRARKPRRSNPPWVASSTRPSSLPSSIRIEPLLPSWWAWWRSCTRLMESRRTPLGRAWRWPGPWRRPARSRG